MSGVVLPWSSEAVEQAFSHDALLRAARAVDPSLVRVRVRARARARAGG